MELHVVDLLKKTVPEHLHDRVNRIFESSRSAEEERLREREHGYKRYGRYGQQSDKSKEDLCESPKATEEEQLKKPGNKYRRYGRHGHQSVESGTQSCKEDTAVVPLTIARVISELWSSNMYRYAEDLILKKAVQGKYIKEEHLKFITVLDDYEKESDSSDWVIQDQDGVIIDLVWNIFSIHKIYSEATVHRSCIQRSYDRLKHFFPEVHPEIIERHDLSKYAFSQALGYALKFVHKTYHEIWKVACDRHLNNEPHHPQAWSKKFSPEEKKQRLIQWTRLASDSGDGCPYGLNLATLNYENEHLPYPFLVESYIDMVAIEWERKKGLKSDITNSELMYMDEKYLMRYTNEQRKVIMKLVDLVISSDDDTWKNINLSEKETRLMKMVPEGEKGPVIFKLEHRKRGESARLFKKLAEKPVSQDLGTTSVESEELITKASEYGFCYTVANVIMNVVDTNFRKYVEKYILERAIKEGFLKKFHLKWIFFAEEAEKLKSGAPATSVPATSSYPEDIEDIVELIWEEFNLREHFSQMKEHRHFIKITYERLSRFMPALTEEVIERHDLSKFALSQAIGYTLKWVHNINSPIWKSACDLHLHNEPHHPQMWQNKHLPNDKRLCLESFLCMQAGGTKYVEVNQLNLASENMAVVFLLESFVDMVSVEWERNKGKREDLSYTELVQMEDKFLNRYTEDDKKFVLNLKERISDADKPDSGAPV